ncbi:zinc finger protein 729-like isoform X2 [Latimeria chalumnae]|uniref:zinc finger protein 729-like isoform X2 n=1 Tax=Latimeria chalumnae TaxID=7897 RepID=UPI00313BEE0B
MNLKKEPTNRSLKLKNGDASAREIAFVIGEDGKLISSQEGLAETECETSESEVHNQETAITAAPTCEICGKSYKYLRSFLKHKEEHFTKDESDILTIDYFTALRDSRETDGQVLIPPSEEMACDICGKKYKYLYSFWKHRKEHDARGQSRISSISAERRKTIEQLRAAMRVEVGRNSGSVQQECNSVSDFKVVKLEAFSPNSSPVQEFDGGESRSGEEDRTPGFTSKTAISFWSLNAAGSTARYQMSARGQIADMRLKAPAVDEFFTCEICGKNYKYKSSFWKHMEEHKNYDRSEGLENSDKELEMSPMVPVGNDVPMGNMFYCTACNESFQTENALLAHTEEHKDEGTSVDSGIDPSVSMEPNQYHLSSDHLGEDCYKCDICGKKYKYMSSFWKHKKEHEVIGISDTMCHLCGAVFSRKGGLRDHIQFVHEGYRPYACAVCNQKFCRPSELNRHLEKRHAAMLPVQISISPQQVNVTSTQYHFRPGAFPSKDSIGQLSIMKKFNTPPAVKAQEVKPQVTVVLPEKKATSTEQAKEQKLKIVKIETQYYTCEHCSQMFTSCPELARHQEKEHPETTPNFRKHRCYLCKKQFRYYCTLWKHKLLHTGRKKLYCILCTEHFLWPRLLDKHFTSVHCQKFKYKCHHCEHGFDQPRHLPRHIVAVHCDLQNLVCQLCKRKFRAASALQEHVRKGHRKDHIQI